MEKKKFQAVLWDVDNTLIMSGKVHDQSVLTALGEFSPPKYRADAPHELDILARAWDESWFACGGDASQLDEFENRVADLYLKNIERLSPRKGAIEIVRLLDSMGIPQAAVSNSRKTIVDANLRRLGVKDIIKARICREDIISAKPAPDPYLRAAERLNLPASLCIVVEDSPRGSLSAKRAGATVVYWPHTITHNDACDYQVADIQAVDWKAFF